MNEAIDLSALNWVQQELGVTLKRGRQFLEEYAEGNRSTESLNNCMACLHEARGPLRIVGLNGADLLATEMEEVLNDLSRDSLDNQEMAMEALMQAFIQLPDYLFALRSSRRESTAALLPVINELRTVRGAAVMPEGAAFTPDLQADLPVTAYNPQQADAQPEAASLARSLRQHFQAGLLDWYGNPDNRAGLHTISKVADSLRRASRQQDAARFWWVASGFVEVLLSEQEAATNESKQLLGQVDRQIKCLIDSGEVEFAAHIPETLLNNLLAHIAASDVDTGEAGEIRRVFALETQPVDCELAVVALDGRNMEVLNTVTTAALEDLEQIKEQLDLYRCSEDNVNDLPVLFDKLHALGNTLAISGLEEAAGVIADVTSRLQQIIAVKDSGDENDFVEIAGSLIAVETSIRDMQTHKLMQESGSSTASLAWNEGLASVISEVVVDMSAAKEHINSYLQAPESSSGLESVPGLLQQIRGGLQLAGQDRAAALVEQVDDYLDKALFRGEQLPDAEQLDLLADAICSIEYFVEELAENRLHGGMVLDIAEQSLEKLGKGAIPAHQEQDVERELPREQSVPVVPSADIPAISGLQVFADDIDREILDIFIEEAGDEIEKLSRLIPDWVEDTDNREMADTICRSFHTLKGGGRMVGALALAEFSWVFEHLFNQVVEGTIRADEKLLELMLEAREPLVQLLDQVKGGNAPAADVDAFVARAAVMVAPVTQASSQSGTPAVTVRGPLDTEQADQTSTGKQAASEPESVVDDRVIADEFPVLAGDADPEIVEIFLEEAEEVLGEITRQLPEWTSNTGDQEALASLRMNFHTLKGSGRMAGAMLTGEFSWTIEKLLNQVIDGAVPVDETLLAIVDRIPVSLTELIAQVDGGPQPESDYRALMFAAETLVRGEQPDITAIADNETAAADADIVTIAESGKVRETIDGEITVEEPATADAEPDIIDIFRRESTGHLEAIQGFVEECQVNQASCQVSESLYRALHTLSGITESVDLPVVHSLAIALYGYFSELNEQRLPVSDAALHVLDNCRVALEEMVDRLPEQDFDTGWLNSLLADIEGLSLKPTQTTEAMDDTLPADRDGVDDVTDVTPVAGKTSASTVTDTQDMPDEGPSASSGAFADIDPELLEIFIEEATDIIDNSERTLRAWQDDHGNRELLDELQRQLHTLKGGARMIELGAIGDLSHGMETLLTRVVDGHVTVSDRMFDCLHEAHDTLAGMLDRVKANEIPDAAPALEQLLELLAHEEPDIDVNAAVTDMPVVNAVEPDSVQVPEPEQVYGSVDQPEADEKTSEAAETVPATESDARQISAEEAVEIAATAPVQQPSIVSNRPEAAHEGEVMPRHAERRKSSRVRTEQVRIQADLLDNLVNYAGEINIYRSRLDQQFVRYRFTIDELQQTINRLRDQLRKMEIETESQILYRHEQETGSAHAGFDPLEMDRYSNLQQLSRSLMESIGDLDSVRELMDSTTRESETLLLQQSRVNSDLQDGLLRTRMMQFASLAPRLRRIVRQAANELGKRVELRLEGADGEMDRTVIERIIAPLEHMLRNAIDHGIETPAERKRSGKPKSGTIQIGFHREGPEIVLRIVDDGRGIDRQAIRSQAIERGLISEDNVLPDDEVMQFILQSGFSTAREVTQISGRGVGMDVVNSEVRQLGGSLHIDSTLGKGSIFTLRLPYTLAINQALLVRAGEESFCIPLGSIEGVVRVDSDELLARYAEPDATYDYAGSSYKLRHLGAMLDVGGLDSEDMTGRLPVLLIRTGEKRIALQVDALYGNREIVVKPLGPQLSNVNGVSGATILGDGRVVLILDLAAVVRMQERKPVAGGQFASDRNNKLTIMVVDDSITVRKVTTRLLKRHGYEVVTAKDGVDAMGKLHECVPDMMLLDIEMPRMDGFELATHMRNDERFRHIPITMITSRTGSRHRERAKEIGINQYLGKPYREHELLQMINRLISLPEADNDKDQEQTNG
ncbi:MAG: Hpt domain-containing protein [Gammaproteobacteria bacterium]|nr:MAG: Hpt domain-containing protein [Gammaproteobacteria bacterium]